MIETLTKKENEIIKWLTKGFLNKEIAHQCGISEYTVKKHLGNIYSKLMVRNRAEAIIKLQNGISST